MSVNGMLTSLGFNYSHRNKNVRLYELGNIYIPKALPLTELPDERVQFTLGMYGEGDFFTMKGVIEEFLDKLGMYRKENRTVRTAERPSCIRAVRPMFTMAISCSDSSVRYIRLWLLRTVSVKRLILPCWICRQ